MLEKRFLSLFFLLFLIPSISFADQDQLPARENETASLPPKQDTPSPESNSSQQSNVAPDTTALAQQSFNFTNNLYVEWFVLKAVGGTYGGGFGLSLFCLNWKWFYWEIVHSYPFIGGAPSIQAEVDYIDWGSQFLAAGTMVGIPFRFDPAGRHEIRIGFGLLGGAMENGTTETHPSSAAEMAKYIEYHSSGPFLELELGYLYRFYRYFSIYAGCNVVAAVRSNSSGIENRLDLIADFSHEIPFPVISAFIGMRI